MFIKKRRVRPKGAGAYEKEDLAFVRPYAVRDIASRVRVRERAVDGVGNRRRDKQRWIERRMLDERSCMNVVHFERRRGDGKDLLHVNILLSANPRAKKFERTHFGV
jgi:hypothetical protein